MEHNFLLVLICLFTFQMVRPITVDDFSSDISVSEYYERSAKKFVFERLSGTKYCESILLPTVRTLRKSLQAAFFNARTEAYSDDKDRLDKCCRSLHKCDAYEIVEQNDSIDKSILHCECVHSFRGCLKELNTSLSNDLALIHSINATKCYAKAHPIIKCSKFEEQLGPASQLKRTSADRFTGRCTQYEFDESQPKKIQIFDLPYIAPGVSTIAGQSNITPFPIEPDQAEKENVDITNAFIEELVEAAKEFGCKHISQLVYRKPKNLGDDIAKRAHEFTVVVLQTLCKKNMMCSSNNKMGVIPGIFYGNVTVSGGNFSFYRY